MQVVDEAEVAHTVREVERRRRRAAAAHDAQFGIRDARGDPGPEGHRALVGLLVRGPVPCAEEHQAWWRRGHVDLIAGRQCEVEPSRGLDPAVAVLAGLVGVEGRHRAGRTGDAEFVPDQPWGLHPPQQPAGGPPDQRLRHVGVHGETVAAGPSGVQERLGHVAVFGEVHVGVESFDGRTQFGTVEADVDQAATTEQCARGETCRRDRGFAHPVQDEPAGDEIGLEHPGLLGQTDRGDRERIGGQRHEQPREFDVAAAFEDGILRQQQRNGRPVAHRSGLR
ncbi:hypothetical protein GCM10009722_39310 [Williamsia deligens]